MDVQRADGDVLADLTRPDLEGEQANQEECTEERDRGEERWLVPALADMGPVFPADRVKPTQHAGSKTP